MESSKRLLIQLISPPSLVRRVGVKNICEKSTVETVCLTFQSLINVLGLRSRGDISQGLVPTGGTCPFAQEDLLLTLIETSFA